MKAEHPNQLDYRGHALQSHPGGRAPATDTAGQPQWSSRASKLDDRNGVLSSSCTGRYSSVVERALRKRTVVGSIPTGGFLDLLVPRCKQRVTRKH